MSFLNPSFLWALGVLLIPVIIHLFNFRRYKKVSFSNVEMLKQIETESRKSRQVKRWLILASRMLALAALVFAFAQPFIPNQADLGDNQLKTVYLDNSLSMTGEGEEGILFEAAKNAARTLILSFPPESKFQVLSNEVSPGDQKLLSRDRAIEQIDDLEITSDANDLSSVVERAQRLSSSLAFDGQRFYVFGDFQKNGNAAKIKSDSNQVFHLVPISSAQTQNLSIDTAWLSEPVSKVGSPIQLNVKVSNNGKEDVESATISLSINGNQQGAESFSVQGESAVTLDMDFSTNETGWIDGKLSVNDYPITFDNDYYFSLDVKELIRVLVISEQEQHPFLKIFANDPGFALQTQDPRRLQYGSLKDFDFIIVDEIKEISSGLAQELSKFSNSGGSLLIIPSTDQSNYQNIQESIGLPVFNNVNTVDLSIDNQGLRHKLFQGVYKEIPANALLPKVKRYYTSGAAPIGFEKILGLKNGDVILGQKQNGKGLVYQLHIPLNEDWSSFAEHEVFVAAVLKMAFSKAVEDQIAYTLNSRAPIDIDAEASEQGFVLKKDEQEIIVEQGAVSGQVKVWLNSEITEPGIYSLRKMNSENELRKLGLNQDRAESIQEFNDEESLKDMLEPAKSEILSSSASALKQAAAFGGKGKPLWKHFIILCLIFLLIEILLLRFIKS
ncbi:hypothetical protein GYB22_00900 [bacterium]|nr:hypothetical protein [bacterium]